MLWTWDKTKNKGNYRKHKISFETAVFVFDDPLALTIRDSRHYEERWRTMGTIGGAVIVVVHTRPEPTADTDEETGRVISARKATKHERREYEEGNP